MLLETSTTSKTVLRCVKRKAICVNIQMHATLCKFVQMFNFLQFVQICANIQVRATLCKFMQIFKFLHLVQIYKLFKERKCGESSHFNRTGRRIFLHFYCTLKYSFLNITQFLLVEADVQKQAG